MNISSIGFPKMHKEHGEKRDFLPEFFENFKNKACEIYLERNYGHELGFTEQDYFKFHPSIRFVSQDEIYNQDLIIVIRSPELDLIQKMKENSGLMTMLHYDTRPHLKKTIKDLKIQAYSLDAIVDDEFKRQVVTYEMTAYAGVYTAFGKFSEFVKDHDFHKSLKVTILGMGNLGFQAARYAYQCYQEFDLQRNGVRGVSVEFLEKEITPFHDSVAAVLNQSDILIDATRRPDPTKIILSNQLLSHLPKNAIILDLTADPYEVRKTGTQVKAIEGIPHGNLDQYIFDPKDHHWNDFISGIPSNVQKEHKRLTISCNAWPGVKPMECMQEYGKKIWPFVNILLQRGLILNSASKDADERALYRATIPYFENNLG